MRCESCKKIIKGKWAVDHITEIGEDNKDDVSITLNKDNLQLLCFGCHNNKTFGNKIDFIPNKKRTINLF